MASRLTPEEKRLILAMARAGERMKVIAIDTGRSIVTVSNVIEEAREIVMERKITALQNAQKELCKVEAKQ